MRKTHKTILLITLVLSLAALACGLLDLGVEPTPTLFPPTLLPPVANPTRTPYIPPEGETGSLNQTGPWMVFITGTTGEAGQGNKLWAANPDGSGLTLLAENFLAKGIRGEYNGPTIAPNSGQIAYLDTGADGLTLELHLISLPSGQDEMITPLFNPDTLQDYPATLEVIRNQAASMAWSPDGQKLAFIAALEGATADLYLYETAGGTITRLTDGPGQAYMPVWSQDGQWILHTATSYFPQGEGYSENLFKSDGIWAVRPDTDEVREISGPAEEAKYLHYQAWAGSRFIFSGEGAPCGSQDSCWQDIATGESGVFPFYLIEYAIQPDSGEILAADYTAPAAAGPSPTFYFTPSQPGGIRVTDSLSGFQWMSQVQAFAAKSEKVPYLQAYLISGGGILQTADWPNYSPAYMYLSAAPDGQHFAWYRFIREFETGLWLGIDGNPNLTKPFTGEVKDVLWNADSSGLYFVSDSFNTTPTEYIQGVYYTPADGSYVQLVTEISSDDYAKLLGWCGN